MIYLDATAIDTFLTCRENYRQRYLENRVAAEPSIHLAFGHAVHKAVEYWHRGTDYENCLKVAVEELEAEAVKIEGKLRPDIEIKWRELALALPECVAVYCDGVEPDPEAEIEQEWSQMYLYPFNHQAALCGKIDRYSKGILYDVKTASEIGRTWKSDYRATLLRTFQFGLYDWYLRTREAEGRCSPEQDPLRVASHGPTVASLGEGNGQPSPPVSCKVECIVKPYRGKAARLEVFDLPEITVYRKRFDQQLAWVVREIVEYRERYATVKPWPMASSQICQGKFSACPYLPICNNGKSDKILANYTQRKEHLQILMETKSEQSIQTK